MESSYNTLVVQERVPLPCVGAYTPPMESSYNTLVVQVRVPLPCVGAYTPPVESSYNTLVVQERAKWEIEQGALSRNSPGQPTYMVATLVVLLRKGSSLPDISGTADMREAIAQLAADVAVDGNLLGAEVLWTPEDPNDVMDRDDLFLNFPALVSI